MPCERWLSAGLASGACLSDAFLHVSLARKELSAVTSPSVCPRPAMQGQHAV